MKHKYLAVLLLPLLLVSLPTAQAASLDGPAQLVYEAQAEPAPFFATQFTPAGSWLYFAYDGELWRTDGTASNTTLVTAFTHDKYGIEISSLTAVGATLYFLVDYYQSSHLGQIYTTSELWLYDGTSPRQLYSFTETGGIQPTRLITFDGGILFLYNQAIWRSDGTNQSTRPIRAFVGQLQEQLLRAGPYAYFTADDGIVGSELWRSDGTPGGTRLVADLAPGRDSSQPLVLLDFAGQLVFRATTPATGPELWISNGMPKGTRLIADLCPGACGIDLISTNITLFDGALYFIVRDQNGAFNLWGSDGTSAGTRLVRTLLASIQSYASAYWLVHNGQLFIGITTFDTGALWRSDGTTNGTSIIKSFRTLGRLIEAGGNLVFYGDDNGAEGIWRSDGTPAGTQLGIASPNFSSNTLTGFGGKLIFTAYYTIFDHGLWASDGTLAGTTLLYRPYANAVRSSPRSLHTVGSRVYFTLFTKAAGYELWQSDGTPGGTRLVQDICPGPCSSNPRRPVSMAGKLYFTATDGQHGNELWASDGTPGGTTLVADSVPGPAGAFDDASAPFELIATNNALFFTVLTRTSAPQLWRSTGTAAGTTLLWSLPQRVDVSAMPRALTYLNGKLFFSAVQTYDLYGYPTTSALWASDGSAASTRTLATFPATEQGEVPTGLTVFGARLVFAADDGTHGCELWASDGTPGGTQQIVEVYPGPNDAFGYCKHDTMPKMAVIGTTLYFSAQDAQGPGLYASDGSNGGTRLVRRFREFPQRSADQPAAIPNQLLTGPPRMPRQLTVLGNRLFFSLPRDGESTSAPWLLWASDGTTAGTAPMSNISLGFFFRNCGRICLSVFYDYPLYASDGRLFFGGETLHGAAFYTTDGTAAGITQVQRLALLARSGNVAPQPIEVVASDSAVFFTGDNGGPRRGLWRIARTPDGYTGTSLAGAAPGGVALVPVILGNNGLNATGGSLSITLAAGLTYLDDTSGTTPQVSGQAIRWNITNLAFGRHPFTLRLRVPTAPYGTRYPLNLAFSATGLDSSAANNTASGTVMIAHQRLLPGAYR